MIVHSVRDNRVIVHSKPVTNNRKTLKIDNFSKNYIIKQSFGAVLCLGNLSGKAGSIYKNAQMSDCNWLSDGILVLCKNSEISYFS